MIVTYYVHGRKITLSEKNFNTNYITVFFFFFSKINTFSFKNKFNTFMNRAQMI